MGLVTVTKVSLNFLERELFREIGLQVDAGDRIGLIGPNGSGKTTLLRLIAGESVPDSGEVKVAKGCRMGYLPQDVREAVSGSLLWSVLHADPERARLTASLKETEQRLKRASSQKEQAVLGERLAEIHHGLQRLEDQAPPHEAEKILLGLGFRTRDFERPVAELSGGWKTRAALAGILYRNPDLLLLDEPTNHLDVPSVHWLEEYLLTCRGAMILVSHDRIFLNRQINRILSFEPEGMRSYTGNYDFYLKAREEEKRLLEARARNQEQKVKDAQKFIERFRYKASKARQAQSKIKLVQKMELVETHRPAKVIRFSFPSVPRSGRDVVTIQGLSKSFGDNTLYRNIDLYVARGERVAIVGPNGCGKTTLLRILAGELDPDEGKILLGHGVEIAYFAQHLSEALNDRKTVIEEVYQMVPQATVGFVRSVCGAFLFSGNDVDKPIGVLSGGERARVSLAKLLVKPGNLMLMDEPTNHLDIQSSETLIDALAEFEGTLVFVSHNQSFVNRLATRIWDITGQTIMDYPGSLKEYYDHISRASEEPEIRSVRLKPPVPAQMPAEKGEKSTSRGALDKKGERKDRAEKRRRALETLQPIRKELKELEDHIAALEARQKEVEQILVDPTIFQNGEKSVPLLTEYKQLGEKLNRLLLNWEKAHQRLEAAEAALEPV